MLYLSIFAIEAYGSVWVGCDIVWPPCCSPHDFSGIRWWGLKPIRWVGPIAFLGHHHAVPRGWVILGGCKPLPAWRWPKCRTWKRETFQTGKVLFFPSSIFQGELLENEFLHQNSSQPFSRRLGILNGGGVSRGILPQQCTKHSGFGEV